MKSKKIKIWPVYVLLIITLSCQKEYNDTNLKTGIEFSLYNATNSKLKCTPDYDLNKANIIILTIQQEDGSPTQYTSEKINVYKMGDAFICEKILLNPGDYKLTEFLVADSLENIIFAAPLEGSELASGVIDPLPINLKIEKDESTKILIEVLSTENLNSTQFGLVWFSVNSKDLYYLQVALTDKTTGKPLSGSLNIFTEDSNMYSATYTLDATLSNVIPIKKGLPFYFFEAHSENHNSNLIYIALDSLERILTGEHPILIIELTDNSVVDVDGNVYKTVKIGNQTWIAENLKTTHLNDNSTIHHSGLDDYLFSNWCSYDFNKLNAPAYCKPKSPYLDVDKETFFYNFYTVETGKLCPSGWHVPTESDWNTLINYLGGFDIAGDKLKDTIPENWSNRDIGNANNESGFTAIATGYLQCEFESFIIAMIWANGTQNGKGLYYAISTGPQVGKQYIEKYTGLKVRCIKDD